MDNDNERPERTLGFRPEIEGLRALAVLSVVLFHLKVSGFQGGYAGVDIFFVISGYLITRNIIKDLESGKFSFRRFYTRRIRRLFPALLFTVFATFIIGALWLPPSHLHEFAESAFTSLTFVSNIYFWLGSHQYFSQDSDQIPLLHIWSLSVEEQFYVFWPILLVFMQRSSLVKRAAIIGILCILSLTVTELWMKRDASAVFYLLPFRIYQFGLGALAVLLERAFRFSFFMRLAVHFSGLTLCLVGINAFSDHSSLPSIVSSLGATLIICAGNPEPFSLVLDNKLALGIGRISYSLYLIHWPIVVFASYIFGNSATIWAAKLLTVVVMLAVACFMYLCIETPPRTSEVIHVKQRTFRTVSALVVSAILLNAAAMTAIVDGGWPWRLTQHQRDIDRSQDFGIAPCRLGRDDCVFGFLTGKPGTILIGDSYAEHYVAALDPIAKRLGLRGDAYLQGGCLVLSGVLRIGYENDRCRIGRDRALAKAKASDVPIIISQAWMGYYNGIIGDDSGQPINIRSEEQRINVLRQSLERTIRELNSERRRFLIIGAQVLAPCKFESYRLQAGPLDHAPPPPCQPITSIDVRRNTDGINEMLKDVQKQFPGRVSLLLPQDYMCDSECYFTRNGLWLYQDAGHLTVAGAEYFGDRAQKEIINFLSANR